MSHVVQSRCTVLQLGRRRDRNMMIKLRGGTVAFQIEVGYIVHEKEWVGGESIKE